MDLNRLKLVKAVPPYTKWFIPSVPPKPTPGNVFGQAHQEEQGKARDLQVHATCLTDSGGGELDDLPTVFRGAEKGGRGLLFCFLQVSNDRCFEMVHAIVVRCFQTHTSGSVFHSAIACSRVSEGTFSDSPPWDMGYWLLEQHEVMTRSAVQFLFLRGGCEMLGLAGSPGGSK